MSTEPSSMDLVKVSRLANASSMTHGNAYTTEASHVGEAT